MSSPKVLAQGTTSLNLNDPKVQHEISGKLIDLQVCQKNLTTTEAAYEDCALDDHPPLQFWQSPTFMIGGFVVTVSATATLICLTHFLGACQ